MRAVSFDQTRRKNPISYYFGRARDLEIGEHVQFFNEDARKTYAREVKEIYDILYDRIMTQHENAVLRHEMEKWYGFNKDFVGFTPTRKLNDELEDILTRFKIL